MRPLSQLDPILQQYIALAMRASFDNSLPFEHMTSLFVYHLLKTVDARFAFVALLSLLAKNGLWIDMNGHELAQFLVWIADSPAMAKNQAVEAMELMLKRYVVEKSA